MNYLFQVEKFFAARQINQSAIQGSMLKVSIWVEFNIKRDDQFPESKETHSNIIYELGENP